MRKEIQTTEPPIDWNALRKKFFAECTKIDSIDGQMIAIDYTPHDLFEWFKKQIMGQ